MDAENPPGAGRNASAPPTAAVVLTGGLSPRAWLFDFDNTLAALEVEVDWAGSRRELEAYLRSEGVDGAIFEQYPKGNLPIYSALLARLSHRAGAAAEDGRSSGDAAALLRRASEMIEAYELRGADRAAMLPGTAGILRALRARNIPAVIVTSNSSRTVMHWLQRQSLGDCVSAIVGRDSMLPLKPDPGMVFHALRICAVEPSEAVFIGDSLADFEAARAARVAFRGVAAKRDARERLIAAGAGEVFASPAALVSSLNLTSAGPEDSGPDAPPR